MELKELKESYPVDLATCAINNKVQDEPAFAWWVIVRKQKVIISKIKSKYWHKSHKYGIRIPKTYEEAYRIDRENDERYWTEGIAEKCQK